MKHILLTTIAAVLVVGCGESQQSAPAPETKPAEPVAEVPAQPPSPVESQPAETVAEAAQPEPPKAKAPDISIHRAAFDGNIEAVKKHLADGVSVDGKNDDWTPLHHATFGGHKEVAGLLIAEGADVNAKTVNAETVNDMTPLHLAAFWGRKEVAELLIANGADVNENKSGGGTPMDHAKQANQKVTADLLRKHGGKTGAELKSSGN